MNEEFKNKFNIEELLLFESSKWIVSVRPMQVNIGSLVISLKRSCSNLN